jgi:hypothetical protein
VRAVICVLHDPLSQIARSHHGQVKSPRRQSWAYPHCARDRNTLLADRAHRPILPCVASDQPTTVLTAVHSQPPSSSKRARTTSGKGAAGAAEDDGEGAAAETLHDVMNAPTCSHRSITFVHPPLCTPSFQATTATTHTATTHVHLPLPFAHNAQLRRAPRYFNNHHSTTAGSQRPLT